MNYAAQDTFKGFRKPNREPNNTPCSPAMKIALGIMTGVMIVFGVCNTIVKLTPAPLNTCPGFGRRPRAQRIVPAARLGLVKTI